MSAKRACCPLCTNSVATFTHQGTRFYMHHLSNKRDHLLGDDTECEATGWLVEDDELLVTPQPRKQSGVAAPSPSSWHCANGAGCKRSDPCSDLCRTIPAAPPVRPEAP